MLAVTKNLMAYSYVKYPAKSVTEYYNNHIDKSDAVYQVDYFDENED